MKAVILAGGAGTRLRPLSLLRPKPMLPFFGAPLLEHTIRRLSLAGFGDICILLCHQAEAVSSYFGDGSAFGVRIEYRREITPRGTAGAVKLCEDYIGNDDFLVVSGDCYTTLDYSLFYEMHRRASAELSIALSESADVSGFGIVGTDSTGKVFRLIEKPAPGEVFSHSVSMGIYAVSPSLLRRIPENTQYDFASRLFPEMLAGGAALYAFQIPCRWYDIGSSARYRLAVKELFLAAAANEDCAESLGLSPANASFISPQAEISPNAVIGPGCIIGGRSKILAGSIVTESIIYSSQLGHGCHVSGSILFPGSKMGDGCAVEKGCVIADGVFLGDGIRLGSGSILYPGTKLMTPCRMM